MKKVNIPRVVFGVYMPKDIVFRRVDMRVRCPEVVTLEGDQCCLYSGHLGPHEIDLDEREVTKVLDQIEDKCKSGTE